jgi:hypothetical protein
MAVKPSTRARPLERSIERRLATGVVLLLAGVSVYLLLKRRRRGEIPESRPPLGVPGTAPPGEDESELMPIGLGFEEKGA